MPNREAILPSVLVALFCFSLAACQQEKAAPDYVARLNDQYLTRAELEEALQTLPAGRDTSVARKQIVEHWVTNALLFEEARRRGLPSDPEVQRLLEQNEQSVLVSALLKHFYEEPATPTPTDVRAYYDSHRDQLRLREPYVRIRTLFTSHPDSAAAARTLLQRATISGKADSLWPAIVNRYARDVPNALELSSNYYPENRLFTGRPEVQTALAQLGPNQIAGVIRTDSLFYLLQLVERVPTGTVPQLSWVEEELKRRLTIQDRKQIYARQVQRLRNEALAREALEIR